MPRPSPKAAKAKSNGAVIGFATKLWQAAGKLRNNMDAAECPKSAPTPTDPGVYRAENSF